MEPIDAFRCARLLMNRHGQDAPLHAAQHPDELRSAGDEAGRHAWIAIQAAIDALTWTVKSPLDGLH